MNKIYYYLIIMYFLASGYLYSQDVQNLKISDNDIAIMKLKDSIVEISSSIANIINAIETSGNISNTMNEKLINIEQQIVKISKEIEEILVINQRITDLDVGNKKELELIKNRIKSNEDASKIILSDIYNLREDINAGRKPVLNAKKPIKEYVPYIALGVSVLSFIIAVAH
ncbi:MAG: hypothetical protein A2539_02685 [Elusimicrobia bacterium RIFOXYD2_FULL_34_15]|nr:MAG: hypothetical protein A2539_02685 [Elusimicrobia bacterium RIFOXYD2_FULL_34_15]